MTGAGAATMQAERAPRVVICGKGELACNALAYLLDLRRARLSTHAIAAVAVKGDPGQDTWEPSLRLRCTRDNMEAADSLDALGLTPGDIVFSLQYDRIVRPAQLGGARAFNLHFSALPDYRGCYPSMWPIRNGESEVGVTLHVLGAGIDDGAIVDQETYRLPAFVDAFGLYALHHAHAFELFKRNLPAILAGSERSGAQPPGEWRYYDRRSIDFAQLELTGFAQRTVRDCLGFLKSLVFPPFQLPTLRGRRIARAEEVIWPLTPQELRSLPEVPSMSDTAAILRCADGLIRVCFDAHDDRSRET